MKKLFVGFLICIFIIIAFLYIIIPSKSSLETTVLVSSTDKALHRTLMDPKNWTMWLQAKGTTGLAYNNSSYTIEHITVNSVFLQVKNNKKVLPTSLTIIPINRDTFKLVWEGSSTATNNLYKRVENYLFTQKLKQDFAVILHNINRYVTNERNIYTIDIRKEFVRDSILISTSKNFKGQPSNKDVYDMIAELQAYAKAKDAKQTGYPMLNVYTKDSINYLTKVAIPVDKKLPSAGNIVYRWMLGGGNILVAEVKGGTATINNAFKQVETYVEDHQRIAPAISFQSLITDRRKEPDTNKWVTKICYPVM